MILGQASQSTHMQHSAIAIAPFASPPSSLFNRSVCMSSTVPIQDVLPWGDYPIHGGRTILIQDSVETDGQFVLYTIVKQYLTWSPPVVASNHNKSKEETVTTTSRTSPWVQNLAQSMKKRSVVWITCGTSTPTQIQSTLKRMGIITKASLSASAKHNIHQVHVISIPEEIATQSVSRRTASEEDDKWDAEIYLRDLYHRIQNGVTNSNNNDMDPEPPTVLILVDQLSSLATMVGSTLALKWTLALRGWMKQQQPLGAHPNCQNVAGLVISSSQDIDQDYFFSMIQGQKNLNVAGGGPRSEWIGAGGCIDLGRYAEDVDRWTHWDEDRSRYFIDGPKDAWERVLMELADGIIDVIPLTSGYSRDVHGRLVFTKNPLGLGWIDSSLSLQKGKRDEFSSRVVNYTLASDHSIQVIRLKLK